MSSELRPIKQLEKPTLIAAWPGMGFVAMTACYYLISKLKMELRAEYASTELFDVDNVPVESGLIQAFRYPKNQVFAWKSPDGENDLMIFLGEAQPPHGRYDFCRKLVDFAQREGVEKIYTFAAMATQSQLEDKSNVVGAAMDNETLHKFLEHDIQLLRTGRIAGMNGILLGVANERKISGGCLLGEMPVMLSQIPYPKASLAVLDAFTRLTGIDLDTAELTRESKRIEAQLSDAIDNANRLVQQQQQQQSGEFPDENETYRPDPTEDGRLSDEEKENLEMLFERASADRSKAFELKNELDRLGVFSEYEDRFLDLFKQDE